MKLWRNEPYGPSPFASQNPQHAWAWVCRDDSLAFIRDNQRVVGYDNERGKGDHKHLGPREVKYTFVDIETL